MNKKNINFDDRKIKKVTFTKKKNKKKIIQMILMLIKYQSLKTYDKYNSLKYFFGYNDNDVIRSLCLKVLKMSGYVNEFNENKNTITMFLRFKKFS